MVSSGYEHLGSAKRGFVRRQRTAERVRDGGSGQRRLVWAVDRRRSRWPYEAIRDRARDELATVLQIAAADPGRDPVRVRTPPRTALALRLHGRRAAATPLKIPAEGIGHGGGSPAVAAVVVAQTRCVDRLVGDTAVVPGRKRSGSAVVIVFSDHGPDAHLDWSAPDQRSVRRAQREPVCGEDTGTPGLFPDDVTLVNVLPILFNAYLGTDTAVASKRVLVRPSSAGRDLCPESIPVIARPRTADRWISDAVPGRVLVILLSDALLSPSRCCLAATGSLARRGAEPHAGDRS